MQLSAFELVKRGVSTSIDVVDAFARTELLRLENLINNLATVARTGSYNDLTDKPVIPTDLNPTYFQLTSSGSPVTIEQQDCWCQGNRVHIAFSATSKLVMPKDYVWGIVPNEYRGKGTHTCGFIHIDGNPDIYINSVKIDGAESGYIYQTWAIVPADTRVSFIADYFI